MSAAMSEYPTVAMSDLSDRQRWTVERIRREAMKHMTIDPSKHDEYEEKEFTMHRITDRTIAVYICVGRKGDEGTYAELVHRAAGQFFVGPRGGVSWHKARSRATVRGKRELWRAFYDGALARTAKSFA